MRYLYRGISLDHLLKTQLKCSSAKRLISYYVTTPIFYANSSPHIGHVHTLLLADAINLFHRLKLNTTDTILSTGNDEHGIKIQTAAEDNKLDYKKFCDTNSKKFSDLFSQYDTTLTDFIRTSEDRHKRAVGSVWQELSDKGFIYKSTYSGWYCSSDETFVPESQVTEKEVNGQLVYFDQNDNQVLWSSEANYMFRLSRVEEKVYDWLNDYQPVVPHKFNDEAISMMKRSPIGDISISRPKQRLKWGIEVPNDPTQTIYVWLDALTNYLTVVGYPNSLRRWPIDCQVIGKDIIKFHAIYWPAFLIALSMALPKKLVCHSHWLIDSLKMSKSRGNVVNPLEENQLFTSEGLRYYLLRAGTPHSDTDYSRTQALRRINAELADTYGNLMSRCCAPAINPKQMIPKRITDDAKSQVLEIRDRLRGLAAICESHYENADFYKGVDEIMSVLRSINALYEETKPWKLIKDMANEDSAKSYYNLQSITFETLRICSILLQPIIPKLSNLALKRMNVSNLSWQDARLDIKFGDPTTCQQVVNQEINSVLFRRIKAS